MHIGNGGTWPEDFAVYLYNPLLSSPSPIIIYTGCHVNGVSSISYMFFNNKLTIITGGWDNYICLFDLESGKIIQQIDKIHTDGITGIEYIQVYICLPTQNYFY